MSLAALTNAAVSYRNDLAHAIADRYSLDAKELVAFVDGKTWYRAVRIRLSTLI